MNRFSDRHAAGHALGARLSEYTGRDDVIVLALPRGGVPVAYEVATTLGAPLDVFTVRKLGAPWNPEFAIGAIATGGVVYVDDFTVRQLGVTQAQIEEVVEAERMELERRERLYRGDRPPPVLRDRAVILVDDGLATGATMRAAVQAVRVQQPREIVVAAPVGSREACSALTDVADRTVCAFEPEPFYGVGLWYDDFRETSDQEVLSLLRDSATRTPC